jgi:hypothetical protein
MGQAMRNRRVRMPLLIALANSAISSAQVPPPTPPSTPGAIKTTSPTNSTNSTDTPEPLPVTTVSLMNNGQIPLPTPDSLNWTDPCAILPLQPATWNRLNLDQYLANYPGGQNYTLTVSWPLTLWLDLLPYPSAHVVPVPLKQKRQICFQDYALSVSVQNWVCGIGEACDAQQVSEAFTIQFCTLLTRITISLQPCNPIPGPQWEVLYAVQNWNLVQNTLYNAIGMAVSMTQCRVLPCLNAHRIPIKSFAECLYLVST